MRKILEDDLRQIKVLANHIFKVGEVSCVRRLGGLTNHTYAVELKGSNYLFRLPGEGTEQLINRKDEKVSSELASSIGVDTELIYFNGETGVKISSYVEGAVTMSPQSMRETKNLQEAAGIFRSLHACGQDTGVPFEVFEMAESYEKIILEHGVELFPEYKNVRKTVMTIKREMEQCPCRKVPCHNDPLCENWVRGRERMYLVDWEYAGMNDPMWDLADLSIEAEYGTGEDELLLEFYYGERAGKEERLRFYANKIYLDFLWSLWGKTRVPYDGETMEQYAAVRYKRLEKNLNDFNKQKGKV